MQCKTIPSTRDPVRAACLVLPLDAEGKSFTPQIPLDDATREWVLEVARRGDLSKANGSCLWVPLPTMPEADQATATPSAKPASSKSTKALNRPSKSLSRSSMAVGLKASTPPKQLHRVLLVRLSQDGKAGVPAEKGYVDACKAVAKHLDDAGISTAVSLLQHAAPSDRDLAWASARLVLACREQHYRFDVFKREASKKNKETGSKGLQSLFFAVDPRKAQDVDASIAAALALANGMDLTRDLGNTPPNICTPEFLADKAQSLGKSHKLEVQVLERRQMQALGMGALLAVAQGSSQAPRLIVMH
ncbi:MAG: hypothetical protein EBW74_05700 [Betaproteobacteria bacterium]|nr:hypothetical protein [Betaproteobacteria bacterium]